MGWPLHSYIDKASVLIGAVFIVSGREVCGILMSGPTAYATHKPSYILPHAVKQMSLAARLEVQCSFPTILYLVHCRPV